MSTWTKDITTVVRRIHAASPNPLVVLLLKRGGVLRLVAVNIESPLIARAPGAMVGIYSGKWREGALPKRLFADVTSMRGLRKAPKRGPRRGR